MNPNQFLDQIDQWLCRAGLLRAADWDTAIRQRPLNLYAGGVYRGVPQYKTHLGVSLFERSTRNITFDLRRPMPLADSSVDVFQSEDVFEHIEYDEIPPIIDEVFRVLKPGGFFRLSVPDYRCPIMRNRSVKDAAGDPIFDPGGGGAFVDGKVTRGGHVWFPVFETVKALMDASRFDDVRFLHYTTADGQSVLHPIDYSIGHVQRTPDNDERAAIPRIAMSIVIDAVKH